MGRYKRTVSSHTKPKDSFEAILSELHAQVDPLEEGQNVLVETGKGASLMKLKEAELRTEYYQICSNRVKTTVADIKSTHRIDFSLDEEFGIYLPSSDSHNLIDAFIAKRKDGRTIRYNSIITDEKEIIKKMQTITRPDYFKRNIIPFLESRATDLEAPKWRTNDSLIKTARKIIKGREDPDKPIYKKFNMTVGVKWLSNVASDMKHGDFTYVGSKENVYLLGIAKTLVDTLYMEGTYCTSTKPMLFFSNNYLGSMSKAEMQMPHFAGRDRYSPSRYRSREPLGFGNQPFIFTAIGRSSLDGKNEIFAGEPEIITGDLSEAVKHFRTTDFKEFEDVVKKYANIINEPTLGVKREGRYYY